MHMIEPALLPAASMPNGGKHAVLLIHGLCGTPYEMAPLAARLRAAGYHVRAPLGPGYGMGVVTARGVERFERWVEYFAAQFDELASRYSRVSIGGLCIGSNIAIEIAARRVRVASLLLISTTLFYDGWNVPALRALLPLGYYTPLRRWYRVRETDPYGIKNPRLREWVAGQMQRTGGSMAGAASLPLTAIYQAQRLIRVAKRSLRTVRVPTLVMHARQDDVASLRSADLVCTRIGSREVTRLVFDDSYHMLTLDNERAAVAQAAVDFLERRVGEAHAEIPVQERPLEPLQRLQR
jgi:carboxylesterase